MLNLYTVKICGNWEASGNGFGMRELNEDGFGHLDDQHYTDGDNRSSFIIPHLGHQVHHLYIWHISDTMGILSDVLNVLSKDVRADSDYVHTDTAVVQRKRKKEASEEEAKAERAERKDRKQFRNAIGNSMTYLAISDLRRDLRKEEDKVEKYELWEMEAREEGHDEKLKYYKKKAGYHRSRCAQIHMDINEMRTGLKTTNEAESENDDEE